MSTLQKMIMTLFIVPAIAHTVSQEKPHRPVTALTIAKITGYTAELLVSCAYLMVLHKEENFSYTIVEKWKKQERGYALFNLERTIPFLCCIGHSAYGLATELNALYPQAGQTLKNIFLKKKDPYEN